MLIEPKVQAFLICEKVIVDQITNQFSLIGLFDLIPVAEFPTTVGFFGY